MRGRDRVQVLRRVLRQLSRLPEGLDFLHEREQFSLREGERQTML
jgi:hypothetical protein